LISSILSSVTSAVGVPAVDGAGSSAAGTSAGAVAVGVSALVLQPANASAPTSATARIIERSNLLDMWDLLGTK